MIRKLLIVCLFVAVCLELNQGKPSSQAKMMEEYADALVQEVINQSYKEMALAQKSCSGKKIGKYTHMHNCKNRGGKCCSDKDDRSNGRRCDKSQKYCGYCFN